MPKQARDARAAYLAAYKRLSELAKKNNIDQSQVDNARLTNSYLRFESTLSMTNTSFDFPILVSQQNPGQQLSNTEVRLNLQDAFMISEIGYFLNFTLNAAGNAPNAWADKLLTYPTSELGLANLFNLNVLWNAKMTLSVDNIVYQPAWDTLRNLYIPQTMYPTAVGAPNNLFFNQFDEVDGSSDGFYPCEPNIFLWGNANNVLNVELPHSIGAATWTGEAPKLVILVRGILAQNVTNINLKR